MTIFGSLQTATLTLLDTLAHRSPRRILALGVGLLALLALIDYVTGIELSFAVFYLIPITLVVWYRSTRAGILMALASAVVWMLLDLMGGGEYSNNSIPFWNAGVRLGFFLAVIVALSALRAARGQQDQMSQFIVHDLRSPLANMLIGLEFMLDESMGETDVEQMREVMRMSVISGNRMMILINSLLDVGRLKDGKMLLHRENVPLQALLEKSAEQMSALCQIQDVSITVEVLPGTETLHADADLTQRILINLLSNAVKYSPPGSAVELRAEPDASGMVKISITDHGPGIEKQWADKLFNSYVQVPARQAGIGVGTGLGLSFSRLAVEAQGGRIWLESEVGAGSSFIFTLPRNA